MYATDRCLLEFSELVNAITDHDRTLRGHLVLAWDLARLWRNMMPSKNRAAMPQTAWMAMIVLSVAFGWTRFAAILGLGFTGLLRPGEWFQAARRPKWVS